MKRICLIACTKSKKNIAQPAKDLYSSALFEKSIEWMKQQNFDHWFILSAKHGLLHPDKVIEPYNLTLKTMASQQKKSWADSVYTALEPYLDSDTSVTFLAGKDYQRHLLERLTHAGCKIETPLEGMVIGKRMQWLNRNT